VAVTGYTSDDLLTRVKARAQVPDADDRLTDADMLAIADDAIRSTVARIVWNADDGRIVRTQADVALVADQSDYRIPDRAVASAIYDVLLVDSAGNERSSAYVDSADAWRWRNDDTATGESDRAYAHTLEGDVIRLLPTPKAAGLSLRVKYRRRPSRLVAVSACVLLGSSSSSTVVADDADSFPAAWTSEGSGLVIDVVRSGPSGDSLTDDVPGSTTSDTFTRSSGAFDTTGPYAPSGGDYACLAGETCVLPVPEEAVPFLTVLVALEIATAFGDTAAMGGLGQLVAGRRKELVALVDDRNREDEAIIPRSSHLRGRSRWWWA